MLKWLGESIHYAIADAAAFGQNLGTEREREISECKFMDRKIAEWSNMVCPKMVARHPLWHHANKILEKDGGLTRFSRSGSRSGHESDRCRRLVQSSSLSEHQCTVNTQSVYMTRIQSEDEMDRECKRMTQRLMDKPIFEESSVGTQFNSSIVGGNGSARSRILRQTLRRWKAQNLWNWNLIQVPSKLRVQAQKAVDHILCFCSFYASGIGME